MRCVTASQIKAKSGRGAPCSPEPRAGTRTREVYDLFKNNAGRPVEFCYSKFDPSIIVRLTDFYGLDIRRLQNGYARTGRKSIYVLAGEWFGRVYVDYIAEHISSSPHSSDVEQPHCRRTRAGSSPAAGTNSTRPNQKHSQQQQGDHDRHVERFAH